MPNTLTIYLLEDSADDVYLFNQSVHLDDNFQYVIVDFSSLTKLQAAIHFITPDLLVIDLNIPESQGLQTLVEVKHMANDTPIIVLTGNDESLGIQAIQLGAQDYLLKEEINYSTLKRAIRFARERSMLYAALEQRAIKDKLTKLYNRAAFDQRLANFEADFIRYQRPYALIMFDLNGFKTINDEYGHLAGDKILQHVADRFQMFNRASDFICRYGGDEFILIVPNVETEEQLVKIIDSKRNIINGDYTLQIADKKLIHAPISIAIGGAIRNIKDKAPNELLKLADQNMYADKLKCL
ncbi:GGDEF domain-containing response regulator [Paraglaciecola sp. L3A3]|uniref:GGDEF domain-containing protein n=1 Tax=Paraglaciecola sp. L3A3 TaxID=2686358 RepID=UPI00131B5406|nr:GGDEF domain-containing response regulator [Paraglaciecola sp. L3A3]